MTGIPASPKNVLLLWIGRLGDYLLSTSFLEAYRRCYPEAKLTLVTGTKAVEAVARTRGVHANLVVHPAHTGWNNLPLLWRLWRGNWDLAIDLNPSYSRAAESVLRLAAPAHVVRSRELAFDPDKDHMLKRYERLAKLVGIPFEARPFFEILPEDVEAAGTLWAGLGLGKRPAVVIHCGNFRKNENRWPEEKFAELARRLAGLGRFDILFSTGPGEERKVEWIARHVPGAVVLPVLPLGTLASVYQKSRFFIGNSTGPLHLASAVGLPTFTLLSQHGFHCWKPLLGPHAWVVSKNWVSCQGIGVDEAWEKLQDFLKNYIK